MSKNYHNVKKKKYYVTTLHHKSFGSSFFRKVPTECEQHNALTTLKIFKNKNMKAKLKN